MNRCIFCGVFLLAVFFPSFCRSLVCYDNLVAKESVLIGCNFKGAACGITNKTTVVTSSWRKNKTTDHKVLYHCAERSTSCTSGPGNYCNAQSKSEKVSCVTSCCATDNCNLPADPEFKVETVPQSKSLSCYLAVGKDGKRVKCMFKEAVCLYLDIGPPEFLLRPGETQKRSISQLCTTRKYCNDLKTTCSSYGRNSWDIMGDKCTMKCCTTDYCNKLPSNTYYEGHPPADQNSHDSSDHGRLSFLRSKTVWYVVGAVFIFILSLSIAACRRNRRRAFAGQVIARDTEARSTMI